MILRGLALALLVALASGCSRTDFAYRNADWFIERYAAQAVAIDAGQREQWRPVVQATLQRHREEVLPLVIDYLDLLEQALQDREDTAGVQCLVDSAILLYDLHARLAVEMTAPLLAELDAGQIQHLADYLGERANELRERYRKTDPREQHASRLERVTGRIEHWTGRLTDAQQLEVDAAIDRIPDLTGQWLTYRAEQTGTLLSLLERGADEPALREHLTRWWVQRTEQPAGAARRWDIAMTGFIDLLHTLDTSMTERQRAAFRTRVTDLREDLATFQAAPQQAAGQQRVLSCDATPA